MVTYLTGQQWNEAMAMFKMTPEQLTAAGYAVGGMVEIQQQYGLSAEQLAVYPGLAESYPSLLSVQPGDPPPAPSYNGVVSALPAYDGTLAVVPLAAALPFDPTQGYDVSSIGLGGLAAMVAAGGAILLGVLKAFIARFGWQTIGAIVGTAVISKVVSMFNDPDNTSIELAQAAGVGNIVKRWTANGRQFWMTDDGWMFVRLKSGVIKRWKPKKPLVLVPGGRLNLKSAVRAQRFLDRQWRTIAKRTKQLKLA